MLYVLRTVWNCSLYGHSDSDSSRCCATPGTRPVELPLLTDPSQKIPSLYHTSCWVQPPSRLLPSRFLLPVSSPLRVARAPISEVATSPTQLCWAGGAGSREETPESGAELLNSLSRVTFFGLSWAFWNLLLVIPSESASIFLSLGCFFLFFGFISF